MKNRIGSKRASAGLAAVLLAGAIMSCAGEPAGVTAAGAETGGIALTQTAVWTDRENWKGAVRVEVTGLERLYVAEQTETLEAEPEPDTLEEENTYAEEVGEAAGFSDEGMAEYEATDALSREPVFVMYLSEYFLLDESEYTFPEGWTTREIPVTNQEGRETTITCISCPVRTEDSWQLTIPVVLRQEYRYPAAASVFPVSQDAPLEKSGEIGGLCAAGTFIMEEREGTAELLAYAESALLELDAARVDFSVALEAQQEEAKAGQRLYYQLLLENTGEITLENISFTAAFAPMELEPLWESENNLVIENSKAVVTRLAKGETKTLTFSVKTEEDQSGSATAMVTASTLYPGQNGEANNPFDDSGVAENNGELLVREAVLPVVIAPLRAAFTVDKTADCEEAGPGDTITYQICIRNTGERTLHSVISTERFLHSNIRAQFEEKEGIELNSTKTQARIPQIPPGDCVNLKASVILPDTITDNSLINQVIVVTDETGEDQALRSQAEVKVKAEPSKTPSEALTGGSDTVNTYQTSRTSPKTGDNSHKALFEALLLCSVFISAAASIRLFTEWRRGEKGKRKR
ncbi:hypothetical protein [Ruminococcus sp. 5_1_39BFAA]|uniref:hypothetical protein n=1 Tax=Ruminococcus sp. 5_1_39BFAA TaxID=457412 RepID=UPI00356993EF